MNTRKDIVIIGSGLTGLTLAYYLTKAGKSVVVIDKNKHIGGVIQTIKKDGFTFEIGPNTGTLSNAETVQLFEDLKNDVTLEIANPQANNRWIWKDNKWNSLPSNPIAFFKTPLFSRKDKLGILSEPFKPRGTNPNETLADMVRRRLGDSFLNYAVNPFISGIYAGNPETLIPKYALPKLYNLEQKYGSFIKGGFKKKKEPKTELQKKATGKVFSAEGGLSNLVKALVKAIGEENIISEANVNIDYQKPEYVSTIVTPNRSQTIPSQRVISTIGGYALSKVFSFISDKNMKPINDTKYAQVCQVIVGYKKWQGIPLNAFGGLNPTIEKRDALGILFTGSLFKGRKSEEGALLSVFMGGVRRPDIFEMTDDELTSIVKKEIRETLNSSENPDLIHINRYKHAIPQYEITSKHRFETIKELEKLYPGLIIAGNIRDGIGMADRIKQAKDIAIQIIENS
ncbi:protoporphyrinogen oxidase [Saccharicrinis aurantiacus]|uniref:protoporphyrinogen oxidase n=1 Tax=Saccharicrinis aurantiacus TaxID=1849719 RepID=UPI000839735D|nr:protoporphyrinogen oxidase [Saccharicrinis aurantiacus]